MLKTYKWALGMAVAGIGLLGITPAGAANGGPYILTGAGQGGGPHVRSFQETTGAAGPASFFATRTNFTGGVRVTGADVDGDGNEEIVTALGPGNAAQVRVWNKDGTLFDPPGTLTQLTTNAYPGFGGGLFVAAANIDDDPEDEIITGADAGGGPHVKVFNTKTGSNFGFSSIGDGFMAYTPGFTGGVRVAAANVDGEPDPEIITAPGPGGGPHIRSFEPNGTFSGVEFMAYNPAWRGGVFVGGEEEAGNRIVTGADAGGGPHVRVFAGSTLANEFMAYDIAFPGGVRVAFNPHTKNIVTGPGSSGGPHIRVFTHTGTPTGVEFMAYTPGFLGGVYVGNEVADLPPPSVPE